MKTFNYKLLIKLLTYASPYKYLFIGTIFISIFFGLLSTVRPILIQYAFDNFILSNDTIGLLNIIIIIFCLLLIESILHFLFVYQSNALSQKIINNIRNEVFEKILSFKLSYFDNTPTGQLITRVVSDMEAVASVFSQGLLVVFGDFFSDGDPMFQIDWDNLISLDNLISVILVQGFCLVLGYLYPITIDAVLGMRKK